MELFILFTRDAAEVFLSDALGDRIVAMLNHNILQVSEDCFLNVMKIFSFVVRNAPN
jgi:hypothetical protein